jgi:Holliday junction resolvase-like predicted endonuclease
MTISDVFALRRQGRVEEAYETARQIYAADKSSQAAAAMYLSALDMRQLLLDDGQTAEADKIVKALERLLTLMPEHLLTGVWGENVAADYLCEKGYLLMERDWHSNHRDIDIIARQGDCIVFVEVKTRRNRDYADPLQAVGYQKLRNLGRAINHYLYYRQLDNRWRFDVITVVGSMGSDNPEIDHIEDFPLR